MRRQRLYLPCPPQNNRWQLPEKRAHYLRRVLRFRVGFTLTVFDGSGSQWEVRVADANCTQLEIIETHEPIAQRGLPCLLIQCLGRGERMDYALQKSTELGVRHIMPVTSERTEVRLSQQRAAKRLEHWAGIVIQASEQSGRRYLPQVSPVQSLDQALAAVDQRYDRRLALTPTGTPLARQLPPPNNLALLVGPEGGLTDDEIHRAQQHGFFATAFGPRVLRTETAGPAMLAAAQALWGDLAN